MKNNDQTFLGQEKLGRLMGKYSVPCVISLLVAALYNIVDQIFIANAAYLGSDGNAANTVVFPLTVIALAIAVMIGDGRVRGLFTRLLICEAAAGAIATLIVELFPTGLIAIFGAANESAYYTEFAVKCFRIYLCMMPLACVNKAAFIFLQAMGKAVASTALSMIREIVFGVGLVLVLPLVWGLDGVIISMPAADILAFIASAIVIIYTYRTLKKDESKRLA